MSTSTVTPSSVDNSAVSQPSAQPSTPAQPSQPAQSSQPVQGAQPQQGGEGLPQLRQAYDKIKADYEPYQKLNLKPEQITQYSGVYQKVFTEAAAAGRELGYPDEEIQEALAEDPLRTIEFLRNEAQRQQQGGQGRQDNGPDLQDLVAQHVEKAIGPIQERENIRMTDAANSLFERTVHQLAADTFKAEGLDVSQVPQDELFMLTSAASEILKYDPTALHALKFEGKTAPIQKAFQEARTMLDKYYLARSGRDRARVNPAQPGRPAAAQPGKRPSLDEMIDNPELIDHAQGRSGANSHYR